MEKVKFENLNLSKTTLEAIAKKKFEVASEIQAKVIPIVFEKKNDIIGVAQTGTGKTGAFGLPLIDLIKENNKLPQSIILAPTRELALQVTKELNMFCGKKKLNILTVYGGASISTQIRALKRGVDIVVGTPGRVVDLLKRGELILEESKYFILDEADEMLKMGFIEDIEFVLESSSKKKRVYLFSATMPDRIKQLSKKYMKKQTIIEVKKKQEVNNLIAQGFHKVKQSDKFDVLTRIIDIEDFFYGIIFCRTKADVDKVTKSLKKTGHKADCIHGDIVQSKRETILKKFKDFKIDILVATDVAARGIDVENLSHVINYNLPEDTETYTHRIGRTGRAGNKGSAISLVTPAEMRKLSYFEKTLKTKVEPLKLPSFKQVKEKADKKFFSEVEEIISKANLKHHIDLAKQLLEQHDPHHLISALLHKMDDKKNTNTRDDLTLDKSDSRDNRKNRKNNSNPKTNNSELRLFIAKGRMDNLNKNSLVRFIEKETKQKISHTKDVKVCEKFSFLTLDKREAKEIIKFYESKNKRKPLVEIASN